MYIIQKSCMEKNYITLYNVKIYLSTIIEIHFIQFKQFLIIFISDKIPHVKHFEQFDVYMAIHHHTICVIRIVDNSLI